MHTLLLLWCREEWRHNNISRPKSCRAFALRASCNSFYKQKLFFIGHIEGKAVCLKYVSTWKALFKQYAYNMFNMLVCVLQADDFVIWLLLYSILLLTWCFHTPMLKGTLQKRLTVSVKTWYQEPLTLSPIKFIFVALSEWKSQTEQTMHKFLLSSQIIATTLMILKLSSGKSIRSRIKFVQFPINVGMLAHC